MRRGNNINESLVDVGAVNIVSIAAKRIAIHPIDFQLAI